LPSLETSMSNVRDSPGKSSTMSGKSLDDKTKSIITLSVLISLRAEGEIALHTKGAINNGVSPDEIVALLTHASVYAGVPSAVSAIKIIKRTLQEMGEIPTE